MLHTLRPTGPTAGQADAGAGDVHPHPDIRSVVRAELARLAGRFEAADRRAFTAGVYGRQGDKEAAEAERMDAAGDFWAAGEDLADLLLLLLRYAIRHRPEALTALLADALGPELDALARAIAEVRVRRR